MLNLGFAAVSRLTDRGGFFKSVPGQSFESNPFRNGLEPGSRLERSPALPGASPYRLERYNMPRNIQ